MDEKTDDAISAAFREIKERLQEADELLQGDVCESCASTGSTQQEHSPDCPFRLTWEAINRAEQKVREIIQPLEQIASRATWECPESQSLASDAQDALAALKGAHTK